jgi:predicted RNase H-like nuclease (RuvC/YqgF family)
MDSVNKLEMVLEPKEGAVKIVEDGELLWGSEGGWVLIAIVQEADGRTEYVQESDGNGYTHQVQKIVPYTRTRFVLRQNTESTLADLKAKFAGAAKDDWDFRREMQELKEKVEKGDERIEEATKEVRGQLRQVEREAERKQERIARLEEDVEVRDKTITDLRKQLKEAEQMKTLALERLERAEALSDESGMPRNQERRVKAAVAERKNGNGAGAHDEQA